MKTSGEINIYNNSAQMIPIQVRIPGGDFYTSEQQVRLNPGKNVQLPKSHVRMDQVENLQKRGIIKVLYNSD
jgi:hypothetical protein